MTQSDPTREALEQTYNALTRLDKQAGDGGGKRGQVYVTVQTWREAFQPIIANAGAALRLAALSTPPPSLDVAHVAATLATMYPEAAGVTSGFPDEDAAWFIREYARLTDGGYEPGPG